MTQPPQWGQPPQPGQPYGPPGYQQPQAPYQPQPGYQQPGGYPPGYQQHPGYQPGPPHPGPGKQVLPGQANRPSEVSVAIVLNYLLAVGMLAFGTVILAMSIGGEGSLIVMIPISVIVAGPGLLNLIGALSLAHKDFPNLQQSQMATGLPIVICSIGLVRSLMRGVSVGLLPALGTFLMLAVCGAVLFLLSRPHVKEWVRLTHEDSIRRGVVPRNGPRTMNR
ncbi:hypothetical protein N8J89_36520 [Crossiella sp. CA-258035]|uniref:hypothetical protein n=1 Tax=Crossiella sp. CA-258035 TaxID=2981138 RepID=UPI0024BC61CA|nr:hypothetical protein [Crossiella sp. CA-258035]WHT18556.1 hypothetical protein N8J89_36520 [Crossiella sp. CA-258035]